MGEGGGGLAADGGGAWTVGGWERRWAGGGGAAWGGGRAGTAWGGAPAGGSRCGERRCARQCHDVDRHVPFQVGLDCPGLRRRRSSGDGSYRVRALRRPVLGVHVCLPINGYEREISNERRCGARAVVVYLRGEREPVTCERRHLGLAHRDGDVAGGRLLTV